MTAPFLLTQPYGNSSFGEWLISHFAESDYTNFEAVSAFVQRSGVGCIRDSVLRFCKAGGAFDLVVGVDMLGTSYEGLRDLLDLKDRDDKIRVYICKNPRMGAFHPKGYAFTGSKGGALAIGSGNLTARGLYVNYELGIVHEGSPTPEIVASFSEYVRNLIAEGRTTLPLDESLLQNLVDRRLVVSEAEARANTAEKATSNQEEQPAASDGSDEDHRLFEGWRPERRRAIAPSVSAVSAPPVGVIRRFVMRLKTGDAGVGQVTAGTARRSPEIFVPLAALRSDYPFWKWDDFVADPTWTKKLDRDGYGKRDRNGVRVLFGSEVISVNLFYNPDKGDLRIRGEQLRSAGTVGDILQLEMVQHPDYEYIARVIPQASVDYGPALAQCVNVVRGSDKIWGYY